MRRIWQAILGSVICIFVLSLTKASAYANENSEIHASAIQYIDLAGDQRAYGEQVAILNRMAEQMSVQSAATSRRQETPQVAVLCRTDGREIAWDALSPLYVIAGPKNCFTLYFGNEAAAEKAVRQLDETQGIRYAERDGEVTACGDGTYSFTSWGAEEMNYGAYLSYTSQWGSGTATVAVVDSGVYPHSRLAGRMLESGYDYVDADDDATNDPFGHGTNVAGIIADCTGNEPVYLYPIRVLNAGGGGSISNVVNAVQEATLKGVDVINLSLESKVLSAALDEAILDAVAQGITVVVAAGNSAIDTVQVCPAHLTTVGVIVVGSAEQGGGRTSYSNYGASVDVYTYGSGIVCCSRTGGYASNTGTSMAAPHVSGLAAMLRLIHGGMSPAEIERRVVAAAEYVGETNVPNLTNMVPERLGFQLTQLWMGSGDTLQLSGTAFPETAMEDIVYQSSDETVLMVEEGRLTPQQEGTATVTVSCTGFEEQSFEVLIDDSLSELVLPLGALSLEDEAFRGDDGIERVVIVGVEEMGDNVFEECENLKTIVLPESLDSIGVNSFSGAVVVCRVGSTAESFAVENGLNYVAESGA